MTDDRKFAVIGWVSTATYLLNCIARWVHGPGEQGPLMDTFTWGILISLSVFYGLGFRQLKKSEVPHPRVAKRIAAFAVLFAIVSFATPPWDSTDVFVYAASGWEQVRYGLNPYSHTFRDIEGWEKDSMISNDWIAQNRNQWLDLPFVYGFLFALECRFLAFLGHGHLWLTVFLFKFVNLLAHIFVGALLWLTAEYISQTPRAIALYLYAWNPMVALNYLANAHNDIVVGALVALCAVLLYQKRFVWVLPALAAAMLVKYVVLCLAPFALVYLWKTSGPRRTSVGLATAILLIIAVSTPYLSDAREIKLDSILAQLSETTGSFHAFMMRIVHIVAPALELKVIERALQYLGAAALVTFLMYRLYVFSSLHRYTPQVFVREAAMVLLAVFASASKFWAWYLGMVLPLSLLATSFDALRTLTISLSIGHLAEFTGLRRRAIGYFAVTTLVPLVLICHQRHQRRKQRTEFRNLP